MRSVQTKLLLYTVPLLLLVTVAVFTLFEIYSRNAADQQLRFKLEKLTEIQSAVVSESLWNVAEEQTALILSALQIDPDVAYASVIDENDDLIAEVGSKSDSADDERSLYSSRDILYDTGEQQIRIGELTIGLTTERSNALARERLLLAALLAGLLLFALTGALFIANKRTVGKPLSLLMDSIRSFQSDGVRKEIEWQSKDELGRVVSAFNTMQSEQERHESQLKAANDQLESRVRARTSELQSAQLDLQQARDQLTDAIESLAQGFALFDQHDRLVVANNRYSELMGYSDHAELKTGVHFKEVIEYAADSGNFPDAAASGHAWVAKQLELHHGYTKAHVEKYRDDRWQQLGTHRTGVGGTVAVFSDVTEIKQISEELKHSMQVAEAANEAKSAFLATMSHEIRTPLNGIIGMSNLLQGTQLDVEQRDYSSTISVAADTLLTIINDILDFSKVEAGALELERVPIDLVETVESTVELLASKAAEKGIELACQIDSDVPQSVLGDSTRIKQVLMNLLNNAIKFTNVGEVVLTIANNTPGNQFASGSNVLLSCSIRDTGIGIPENRMDRLFKSFSQVDASTTRRFGGTGLGLVITKRLVELMGGEISVESQVGVGTTFIFTVPFVVAELPDRKSRDDQILSLRGSRVLIVDDNRTNRLILSEKLRSWEMDPKATESPVEALELLEQNTSFDTCIIDYKMPEMNGLELARRVRQIKGTSTPPMILFSSISMVEDSFRKGVEEMDFAAVLTKPSRSGQLLDALSKAIVPAADSPVENGQAVTPADTTVPESLASLRILLVDDNFINRKVGKKILTKLGYQPEIVSSGFEAIEQCQANDFDVVLMDIEMPDLDGISASNEIRKRIPINRMPYIIALTANAMSNERESYLQSGMDGYLSKPIDIPALVGSLHDARNYRDQL